MVLSKFDSCLAIHLKICWGSNIFLFSIFYCLAINSDVVLQICIMLSFGEIKTKIIDFLKNSVRVLENKYFIIPLIVNWLSATKILMEHLL